MSLKLNLKMVMGWILYPALLILMATELGAASEPVKTANVIIPLPTKSAQKIQNKPTERNFNKQFGIRAAESLQTDYRSSRITSNDFDFEPYPESETQVSNAENEAANEGNYRVYPEEYGERIQDKLKAFISADGEPDAEDYQGSEISNQPVVDASVNQHSFELTDYKINRPDEAELDARQKRSWLNIFRFGANKEEVKQVKTRSFPSYSSIYMSPRKRAKLYAEGNPNTPMESDQSGPLWRHLRSLGNKREKGFLANRIFNLSPQKRGLPISYFSPRERSSFILSLSPPKRGLPLYYFGPRKTAGISIFSNPYVGMYQRHLTRRVPNPGERQLWAFPLNLRKRSFSSFHLSPRKRGVSEMYLDLYQLRKDSSNQYASLQKRDFSILSVSPRKRALPFHYMSPRKRQSTKLSLNPMERDPRDLPALVVHVKQLSDGRT